MIDGQVEQERLRPCLGEKVLMRHSITVLERCLSNPAPLTRPAKTITLLTGQTELHGYVENERIRRRERAREKEKGGRERGIFSEPPAPTATTLNLNPAEPEPYEIESPFPP